MKENAGGGAWPKACGAEGKRAWDGWARFPLSVYLRPARRGADRRKRGSGQRKDRERGAMKSQITMKDMAQHFGMSLNTIHKAITGKPGVSEATRRRVLEYAAANGYRINSMASCLKRGDIQIAVCFPELDKNSVYFYNFIWQGYLGYMREWSDLNVHARELPFKRGELAGTLRLLNERMENGDRLDGLLMIPPEGEEEVLEVKKLTKRGVEVVFVTGDNGECQRLGAVVADYYAAGAVMAEQAGNILGGQGRVLLMAGNQYNDAHYMIAKGFHEYIRREGWGIRTENLYGYFEEEQGKRELLKKIQEIQPDLIGCVFARGSAVLAGVLREGGLAGQIPVIANDVFAESVTALREGVFTNLVYKDPARQAYMAANMLCGYLVKGEQPAEQVKKVEIALIFRSNVNYYWKQEKR